MAAGSTQPTPPPSIYLLGGDGRMAVGNIQLLVADSVTAVTQNDPRATLEIPLTLSLARDCFIMIS